MSPMKSPTIFPNCPGNTKAISPFRTKTPALIIAPGSWPMAHAMNANQPTASKIPSPPEHCATSTGEIYGFSLPPPPPRPPTPPLPPPRHARLTRDHRLDRARRPTHAEAPAQVRVVHPIIPATAVGRAVAGPRTRHDEARVVLIRPHDHRPTAPAPATWPEPARRAVTTAPRVAWPCREVDPVRLVVRLGRGPVEEHREIDHRHRNRL